MIDAHASETQFLDHLAPVWLALASSERRWFHASPRLGPHAASRGITVVPKRPDPRDPTPIMVASLQDHQRVGRRPVVYVEHGAGQSYVGVRAHGSYAGGPGHDSAVLFLCPSETVAQRWRAAYPRVPAVAVGCPKLDRWHRRLAAPTVDAAAAAGPPLDCRRRGPPVVAVTFHAHLAHVPETRSAFAHFQPALPALAARFPLIGHSHPRQWNHLRRRYQDAGIEPVQRFADVVDRAQVLVVDNSSAGWEWLSLGRPVVWLNPPWYRRGVEHGLRFWRWAGSGVQCDDPAGLVTAVERALLDADPVIRETRAAAVAEVYAFTDGRAAERAAGAIRAVLMPLPA